jgi:DNA-binding beta-propeller fold protein YncE
MRNAALGIAISLFTIGPALAAGTAKTPAAAPAAIALPGGEGGIGFDDLGYSRTLGKVLVPGGRTGRLYLVDPYTSKVASISGFSIVKEFSGGHDDGITSVAEGAGLLFVTDRTREDLSLVDPATKSVVARAPLGASPDYVRWVEPTHELWVTEPDSERFEVYRLESGKPPRVVRVATVAVPGGPESLILDMKRRRAYTHMAAGTAAIDLRSHAVVATWKNGCEEASGLALDAERGFLFVACREGGVNVLDVVSGKVVGSAKLGAGIDIISYSPDLGHLYVPSSETKTLAILGVSTGGALSLLGTFPGTADSHCVAAAGKVYFCDPAHGRLLAVTDPYPPSAH